MTLETKILAIIEGKKSAPIAKALLTLLSQCYKAGVHLRHLAYDYIVPTSKLNVPVISIGNIVAGGTGKTPLVRYFAEKIGEEKKVAILTRGYREKRDKPPSRQRGDDPS